MSPLPTPMVVPDGFVVDHAGDTLTFEECVGRFRRVSGEARVARSGAIEREVVCGSFLRVCQEAMTRDHLRRRGVWAHFLRRIGVNLKTARRQVVMSLRFAGKSGGLDRAKLAAAVATWNASHPVGDALHVAIDKCGLGVTLTGAQVVAGVRPAADMRARVAPPHTEHMRTDRSAQGYGTRGGHHDASIVGVSNVGGRLGAALERSSPGVPATHTVGTAGSSSPARGAVAQRAGFDRVGFDRAGNKPGQLSLAGEYERVQRERGRITAILDEVAQLVQCGGSGGVDVVGLLSSLGDDAERVLRRVRGEAA